MNHDDITRPPKENTMLQLDIAAIHESRKPRARRGAHTISRHVLPVCAATGQPRYRDRAQARDGLRSSSWSVRTDDAGATGHRDQSLRSIKCPDCNGWHNLAEPAAPVTAELVALAIEPAAPFSTAEADDIVLAPSPERTPNPVAERAKDKKFPQIAPPAYQPVMHAIDIENQLVSKGRKLTVDDVKAWVEVYWTQGPGVRDGDLVIVAVSPRSMWMLKAFTGKRIRAVIGHTGPDGADEALLAAIYVPDMSAQYPAWNIGSGDGAFIGLATQAAKRGVFVRMVTTGDTLIAPKLRRAVHVHTRIRTTSRTQTQAKQERAAMAIHAIRSASRVA